MKTGIRTNTHFDFKAFSQRARRVAISLWNGFTVAAHMAYGSGAFSVAFIVIGVACTFFCPTLAPVFLGMGGALFGTTLVVKVLDQYDFTIVNSLKMKACTLSSKYGKLHLISFLFALGISFFSPLLGGFAGAVIGVGSGLIIHIEHIKRLRKNHGENIKISTSGTKENA